MMLLNVNFYSKIDAVMKGKRKNRVYSTLENINVEIEEAKEIGELVALNFTRSLRENNNYDVIEHRVIDGKLMSPYLSGMSTLADPDQDIIENLRNIKDIDKDVKTKKGFNVAKQDKPIFLLKAEGYMDFYNDNQIFNYDDIKMLHSNNIETDIKNINFVCSKMKLVDGCLWIESLGPSIKFKLNNSPYVGGLCLEPDLAKITQSIIDNDICFPLSFIGAIREHKTMNDSKWNSIFNNRKTKIPEALIVNEQILKEEISYYLPKILFNSFFGLNIERKIECETFYNVREDMYLNYLFNKYSFGNEFKMLYNLAKEDMSLENVKNLIEFISNKYSQFDTSVNKSFHENGKRHYELISDQCFFDSRVLTFVLDGLNNLDTKNNYIYSNENWILKSEEKILEPIMPILRQSL